MTEQRKTILIVDDETGIRSLIHSAAQEVYSNALIIEASDGTDALIKARRQVFDLVITDLGMPKMKGTDLIEALVEMNSKLKPGSVLVISAFDYSPKLKKLEPWLSFISKPCGYQTIKEQIKLILNPPPPADTQPTSKSGLMSAQFEVSMINPFLKAVTRVMMNTASTQVSRSQVFIRKDDQISGDISGLVHVSGTLISGSFAISFETQSFLEIVSSMLGESFQMINPGIIDAAGELCNQIFASARKELNEQGYDILPAIPTIITGINHKIKHTLSKPIIGVNYRTVKGKFTVEICIGLNKIKL